MGLGAAKDDASRELVLKGFDSSELGIRRSAFIAAGTSSDARVVAALLKLMEHSDAETRFNAGYTFEELSQHAVRLNLLVPADERAGQIKEAGDWFEANRGRFK
jgi:HEAT repeat protein